MRDYVSHLECSYSGKKFEANQIQTISDSGKPLLVKYDLQRMKKEDKELVYPTDEELDEIELEEEYDDFFDYSDTIH